MTLSEGDVRAPQPTGNLGPAASPSSRGRPWRTGGRGRRATPALADRSEGITARTRWACEGLKAHQVANLTGANRETVRRYLLGETEPSALFLAALCAQLGLSPAWVLLGIGQPYRRGSAQRDGALAGTSTSKESVAALIHVLSRRVEMLP